MNRARVGDIRLLEEIVLFTRGPRRELAFRQGSGYMPGIGPHALSSAILTLTLLKVGCADGEHTSSDR